MLFIRSLLYYLVMIVALAWICLTAWLWYAWRTDKRFERIRWVTHFNRFMTKKVAPAILGLHYRVVGRHNIPDQSAVYLMKHQSAWETIASAAILPVHTWVLKRELLWIPLFGWGLRLTDPVNINRTDRLKAMKYLTRQGKERLQSGLSLVVFPEGTRMPVGKMGAFKQGAVFVAKQSRVPVVPVAHNAGLFWPRRTFIKHSGCITVVIGRPIATENRSVEAVNRRAQTWMRRTMKILERLPQNDS